MKSQIRLHIVYLVPTDILTFLCFFTLKFDLKSCFIYGFYVRFNDYGKVVHFLLGLYVRVEKSFHTFEEQNNNFYSLQMNLRRAW